MVDKYCIDPPVKCKILSVAHAKGYQSNTFTSTTTASQTSYNPKTENRAHREGSEAKRAEKISLRSGTHRKKAAGLASPSNQKTPINIQTKPEVRHYFQNGG